MADLVNCQVSELECTHEDCRCDCAANEDPFGGQAPAQIRVALYQYRFTTAAEKRDGGDWWHRELVWRGRM